ncbi:hypothetical protein CHUAL_004644 [Chamberlinius hualienensis]
MHRCVVLFRHQLSLVKGTTYRFKWEIDRSRVPIINDEDLEEQFVRGSGPGGQHVNKTASGVVLKHIPTGTIVKCHDTRYQPQNRKIARERLVSKLDDIVNGELSVSAQMKRIETEKQLKRNAKAQRLRERKREFKERQANQISVEANTEMT